MQSPPNCSLPEPALIDVWLSMELLGFILWQMPTGKYLLLPASSEHWGEAQGFTRLTQGRQQLERLTPQNLLWSGPALSTDLNACQEAAQALTARGLAAPYSRHLLNLALPSGAMTLPAESWAWMLCGASPATRSRAMYLTLSEHMPHSA